jgi:hypothetical protein
VSGQQWVHLSNVDWDYWERIYGKPLEISVDTLLDEAHVPKRQAIRTSGIFQISGRTLGDGFKAYELCSDRRPSYCLVITPNALFRPAMEFEAESHRGKRVQVVGAFESDASVFDGPRPPMFYWSFDVAAEFTGPKKEGPDHGLRALVAAAGQLDERPVRVRGQFRGRNLFGDLPAETQKGRADWVIADEGVAVWVTGKAPKGNGFALDLDSKSDGVRWVEVEGKPLARDGVVYLRARSVLLVKGPVPVGETKR